METTYLNEYMRTQKEMLKYSLMNQTCPLLIMSIARIALEKLRDHLDDCGYRMPKPRYLYNHADERTWKFIPSNSNSVYCQPYWHNPNFMYRAK